MFLVATMTLCCAVAVGSLALFQPVLLVAPALGQVPRQVLGQVSEKRVAEIRPTEAAQTPVRVVGTPFVPNVNPRER